MSASAEVLIEPQDQTAPRSGFKRPIAVQTSSTPPSSEKSRSPTTDNRWRSSSSAITRTQRQPHDHGPHEAGRIVDRLEACVEAQKRLLRQLLRL